MKQNLNYNFLFKRNNFWNEEINFLNWALLIILLNFYISSFSFGIVLNPMAISRIYLVYYFHFKESKLNKEWSEKNVYL
jgi:hypothetical protein